MTKTTPNVTIVVASHKPYWMPQDKCYLPVWVNASNTKDQTVIPDNWSKDDDGQNISAKNANYCELTALYWAWKNLDTDYLGLAHYRRHFATNLNLDKKKRVATQQELLKLLAKSPVILPVERNYFIETTYSQYIHAHHKEDLETTRQILQELYPNYLEAYDHSMSLTHGHRFNMFIMRKDLSDAYCTWLFSVLFELEKRLDISTYTPNDARVFGFVAERLLDPWLTTNNISYINLPVVNLESQHWPTKATSFLKRKWA